MNILGWCHWSVCTVILIAAWAYFFILCKHKILQYRSHVNSSTFNFIIYHLQNSFFFTYLEVWKTHCNRYINVQLKIFLEIVWMHVICTYSSYPSQHIPAWKDSSIQYISIFPGLQPTLNYFYFVTQNEIKIYAFVFLSQGSPGVPLPHSHILMTWGSKGFSRVWNHGQEGFFLGLRKTPGFLWGTKKQRYFFGYCIFHQLKLTMIQAQFTTCVGFFWVC